MRTIAVLFIILLILIAYAVDGAASFSAPASSRATYTPIAEVTPAPTYTPPAYPGPAEQPQERRKPAHPTPRGGLMCEAC